MTTEQQKKDLLESLRGMLRIIDYYEPDRGYSGPEQAEIKKAKVLVILNTEVK